MINELVTNYFQAESVDIIPNGVIYTYEINPKYSLAIVFNNKSLVISYVCLLLYYDFKFPPHRRGSTYAVLVSRLNLLTESIEILNQYQLEKTAIKKPYMPMIMVLDFYNDYNLEVDFLNNPKIAISRGDVVYDSVLKNNIHTNFEFIKQLNEFNFKWNNKINVIS